MIVALDPGRAAAVCNAATVQGRPQVLAVTMVGTASTIDTRCSC